MTDSGPRPPSPAASTQAPRTPADRPAARVPDRRAVGAAALVGVGLMAGVDEIVFHQLLAWHSFYDRGTEELALLSDGLLHGAELVALVAGAGLLADLLRRGTLRRRPAVAGLLLGLGGFQLFDGLVDHKVLRVHQVRYGVDPLPYDLVWNAAGLVLLLAGAVVLLLDHRQRRASGDLGPRPSPQRR